MTTPGAALRLLAKIRSRTCEWCGKTFQTRAENARFCNDNGGACRQRWHRAQKKAK